MNKQTNEQTRNKQSNKSTHKVKKQRNNGIKKELTIKVIFNLSQLMNRCLTYIVLVLVFYFIPTLITQPFVELET